MPLRTNLNSTSAARKCHRRLSRELLEEWSLVTPVLAAAWVLANGPANAQTDVLRIANLAEPESLDPHKVMTNTQENITRNLFEGLVVVDPKGDVAPGVAESWSVSEDGLTYRFKLRPNARWSNGDPVTAGDFVFSLRRVEDPKTLSREAEDLYPIKNAEEVNTGKLDVTALGVAAPDERTVEITLKAPTPYFLQVLVMEQAMPVHEKTVRLGEDWVKPGKMVSNGAYVLDDWKPYSHIRLVKNPNYWNAGQVAIDGVVFDPTDNLATVLKRYRTDEFDIIINGLPNDQLDWLKQNMPKELHIVPFAAVGLYIFNTTRPPFNDHLIDRRNRAIRHPCREGPPSVASDPVTHFCSGQPMQFCSGVDRLPRQWNLSGI
jgi:oligopeptide transport system substrate-binding protein